MRPAGWQRLVRDQLGPRLTELGALRPTKSLAVVEPVDWVLRGLALRQSVRRQGVFGVAAFSTGLWVPRDAVPLTGATRLEVDGREAWWGPDERPIEAAADEIVEAALGQAAWLAEVGDVAGHLAHLHGVVGRHQPTNSLLLEERGLGLAMLGDLEGATEHLRRAEASAASAEVIQVDWVVELRRRVAEELDLLAAGDASLERVLQTRRDENLATLT